MSKKIMTLSNITKLYPGVVALDNLSLDFYEGEVHALLGENGAGKSTLIKIIAGALEPEAGTITFSDGVVRTKMTPHLSKSLGVEVIYQEFNLVNSLSAAENIFFGEKTGRFVNYKIMESKAKKIFEEFGVDINPKQSVYDLPSSKKQIVEIAKAISKKAKILIMDEPTAPLSVTDVEKMFAFIKRVKSQGVSVIYISHRMDELFAIADKITVLRDGKFIITKLTSETNRQELINYMVGRELKEVFPKRTIKPEEVLLDVQNLSGNGDENISFNLKKGEILGLAGLVGAGRTELARLLYGIDPIDAGTISLNGHQVHLKSPADAIKHKIGLIPEDRKELGCLLGRSVKTNITISCIKRLSRFGVINNKKETQLSKNYFDRLKIKAPSMEQLVGNLSGGNQQKVVLARVLAANTEVLIFDEPTRGIDVGAKQEIYKLMTELADQGKAILMITSEMEELLGMSDRIIVLYQGKYSGQIDKQDFSQQAVLALASGIQK